MRKIFLTSCGVLMLILPAVSFGKDLKWSGVLYLKGTGATNCGKTRITNEAWDRCEDWANKSIKGNEKPTVEDIELYNIAVENDKGPSWNPKLNCNFRASVKCGYSMEKITAAQKLKLSQKNKLKKLADAESCGDAEPEEQKTKTADCEVGLKKDPAADKPAPQPEKSPASSTPEVVGTPPSLLITPEVQLALNQAGVGGMPQGGSDQDQASLNKRVGAVVSALKNEIKWSGKLSLKGKGITNCGESYIAGEAWEICEAWAEKKKGQKGVAVKPEVRDIKVSDVNVVTGKPVANDPNPSCVFDAKVSCGYSTAISVVEHSAGTMQQKGKADGHDLNDLFGDGLRWSELLSIEGSGITNCGKPRIRNEAWDKCEAWAEEQKQKGGRRPTVKKVELYNVASEIEKGPSWDPTKQSCVYHATLKCGYKIE